MEKCFFNILFGISLFTCTLLSSCSNDDNFKGHEGESRMMTFAVNESFGDSETAMSPSSSRAISEAPDTVYQILDDGVKLEVVIEEEMPAKTRATESIANGVQMTAVVINAETNKVHRIQNVTVQSGKIEVEVPDDRNVKVFFYSRDSEAPSPFLSEGDDITSNEIMSEESCSDVMYAETGPIAPGDENLGSLTFKHYFTQVRTTITDGQGRTVNSFNATFKTQGYSRANVCRNGTIAPTSSVSDQASTQDASGGTTSSLSSTYQNLIPETTASPHTLTVSEISVDGTAKTVNTNIGLPSTALERGKRYNVKVNVSSEWIKLAIYGEGQVRYNGKIYRNGDTIPLVSTTDGENLVAESLTDFAFAGWYAGDWLPIYYDTTFTGHASVSTSSTLSRSMFTSGNTYTAIFNNTGSITVKIICAPDLVMTQNSFSNEVTVPVTGWSSQLMITGKPGNYIQGGKPNRALPLRDGTYLYWIAVYDNDIDRVANWTPFPPSHGARAYDWTIFNFYYTRQKSNPPAQGIPGCYRKVNIYVLRSTTLYPAGGLTKEVMQNLVRPLMQ